MNTPTITTRVADLVRNPDSAMPKEWEYKRKAEQAEQAKPIKESTAPPPKTPKTDIEFNGEDTLSLSPLAQKILEDSDSYESDWDKVRNERVQRVQQLVQERQYAMTPEVIDSIAQKIVAMLPQI